MKTIRVFMYDVDRITQDGNWEKVILYTVTANPEDIKRVVDNLSRDQYFEFVEC